MTDQRQHPVSVHHTRRVAKQRRNELIRGLDNQDGIVNRQRFLQTERLPRYVRGFIVRKAGLFQWEVVAVAYATASTVVTSHGRKL